MAEEKKGSKLSATIEKWKTRALDFWKYSSEGVWEDKRDTLKVNVIKTLNLTVRSFMSNDLQ